MRRWLLLGLLPLPLAFASLLLATAESQPLVSRSDSISSTSIADARRLLASNDPRRLRRGDERTALIPVGLIDTTINHFASRSLGGRGAFVVVEQRGEIRLSVPLPGFPGTRYLNVRAVIGEADGRPPITAASVAALPLPAWLAELVAAAVIRAAGVADQWQAAEQAIRRVDFDAGGGNVVVRYVWQPELLEQARSLAVTADDVDNLRAAQAALAGLLDHRAGTAPVPLAQVLLPLLRCCSERSPRYGHAALLVLAAYLSGHSLAHALPEARSWPRARRVRLVLHGRYDSAQHFAVSAALAAWAGEPAANAIGVDKELRDARGGSGFSFADLAADRAGTRFGELVAAHSPRLQTALRGPLSDGDLAPSLAGLPEGLSAADFERRFGQTESANYRQLVAEIERRLSVMPLYR
ncbi:MAG TPA: hypothetical protein PK440_02365 [Candidatus Accumulibacter phosphatis]|nr:MAG: hypothetical protein AW07_01486 [Candidatus Accumulibacter sp. SK-11]HAY26577.1 hypothetical protein [Accumulibacter sp.]HCV12240.1 hypothetical protein [Accumulibacter sp.]HRL75073.1 hypothetical protein [Candidatus Accumulibacter phosphatis]HRQ93844.1 hypothetical protein [Candidatus Accumulibacter phosphatis]